MLVPLAISKFLAWSSSDKRCDAQYMLRVTFSDTILTLKMEPEVHEQRKDDNLDLAPHKSACSGSALFAILPAGFDIELFKTITVIG